MKNSEVLYLFAQAHRKCGYQDYAQSLEDMAAKYEAEEILKESDESDKSRNG